MPDSVSPENIARVHNLIRPYIRRTPVIEIDGADFGLTRAPIGLKLELFQHSGSFKLRGAFANLLIREVPAAGVVAASGGNHGVAVAYAARQLAIPAKIFVPSITSPVKLALLHEYGADVTVIGERYADALAASETWIQEHGALPIHAFDQVETLLGQGSVGLELESQLPGTSTVLVAVGGGGLIGGIAAWFRSKVRIIAVEPVASPTLNAALNAGRPVDAEAGGIAADSLAPRRVGELMFPIAQQFIERVILVPDEAIREAQIALWRSVRVAAEPGGAAAFAALLTRRYQPSPGEQVAVVISGGNTTAVDFSR
jgi:threonine dehydratase